MSSVFGFFISENEKAVNRQELIEIVGIFKQAAAFDRQATETSKKNFRFLEEYIQRHFDSREDERLILLGNIQDRFDTGKTIIDLLAEYANE